MTRPGFTLSELLITLAILGIVSTFAITKLLHAQADARRKAVFRETLAAVVDVTFQVARNRPFANCTALRDFIAARFNYLKICRTDAEIPGKCWTTAHNADGYVLHNGAFVSGFNCGLGDLSAETLDIDWNGAAGPNIGGVDILYLSACFGPGNCDSGYGFIIGSGSKAPGVVGPRDGSSPALYEWIFSK